MKETLFQPFETDISEISIPENFTFPFHYEPHELSKIAAMELQKKLKSQARSKNYAEKTGKMYGVLVVQNSENQLGYLASFSGNLQLENEFKIFVPLVFNWLQKDGFYKIEESNLNALNLEIEKLESNPEYLKIKKDIESIKIQEKCEIDFLKQAIKESKKLRSIQREQALSELDEEQFESLKKQLILKSQNERSSLKKVVHAWNKKNEMITNELSFFTEKINSLKEQRKQKSAALQQKLFSKYSFVNQYGISKNLLEIFAGNPPAGAGECAAPKLLQYAFLNQLKPIAMAEFWWGKEPETAIRKHQQFYPACTSKCEPILNHMLEGISLEKNTFVINKAFEKEIEIVFEDDYIVVVNKPADFLSVPGKRIVDSVFSRMKLRYPNATGPLLVHRLDMATSGLLLIAKSSEIHKNLQSQFIKREVKKRYVALLDGLINERNGTIDLPLRVDYENRPNQLVCFEYGKSAQTMWEVIKQVKGKTLVYFYPITGRTHQLRVHAAHKLGLKTPILGDELYGLKSNRLYLHAESITFKHPITRNAVTISIDADF